MRKLLGVATALALASGASMVTTGAAQEPHDEAIEREIHVAIARANQDTEDTLSRQLAVLGGRGVQLGVTIRDVDGDREDATPRGVLVDDVREDSPAAKAGFQTGDIITEFDGERVRSARQLSRLVSETPDGTTVRATVVRGGQSTTLSVTPEAGTMARRFEFRGPDVEFEHLPRPPEFEWREREPFDAPSRTWEFPGGRFMFRGTGGSRLGVTVQNLTPQLADYFGTESGALITSVEADSAAAKAGLKAGDVITAVNGETISDPAELSEHVRSADAGVLSIDYTRDRQRATAEATIDTPSERTPQRHSVRPI